MTTQKNTRNGPATRAPRKGRVRPGVAALCLLVTAAGCDLNLLEQEAPSRVEAEVLEDPSNAELLVRSAISSFECALGQHILATGLVGDELSDGSLREVFWDYDRRTLSGARGQYASSGCEGIVPGNYLALSTARFQADHALGLLESWTDEEVPGRAGLMAQAGAYAGYSLVLMGESFCSTALDLGPELLPADIFTEAIARFDVAITAAETADDATTATLARLGRARALLNLGDLGAAANEAAQVPQGFEVSATYSDASTRRQNRLFTGLYRLPIATVDPSYRDLAYEGVPDPRVEVVDAGVATSDADVPLFQPAKYSEVSSPIRIASWEEAQLILAEAHLAAGEVAEAADRLDALHAAAGLPPYDGGTAVEVAAHLIEERRRELFLEGHRLGDIIRYGLALDPAEGTPFHRGGTYGGQVCFPLPDVERNNNPNL